MDDKVLLTKDSQTVKNPKHLERNTFLLYSSRKFTIDPAVNEKINTEVTAFLPKNSRGFITSKFRTDGIDEPFYGKHRLCKKKTRREIGSFLNHYDFAYVRKDTANQAAKVAPGIIKGATNKISKIVQQRIDQIISQGGKEIERVLRVILRRAIEDVYQTPFRLLGDFGKKQLNKLKSQILR